jgi:hypothetical protein
MELASATLGAVMTDPSVGDSGGYVLPIPTNRAHLCASDVVTVTCAEHDVFPHARGYGNRRVHGEVAWRLEYDAGRV